MTPKPELAALKEIPLPPPISWAPQTAGWVVVALLVMAAIAWIAWRRHARWVADRYRRAALAELAEIERTGATAMVPALLKRTALAFAPRAKVAALSDAEWLAFLDRTCPPGGFATGPGRALTTLAYGDAIAVGEQDCRTLLELSRRWIEHHDAGL